MEAWIPLFDIFLNSQTPESEASIWLQQSLNTSTTFLTLLSKPVDTTITNSSSSPHHTRKRVMWIQTLPNAIQSRILSFLRIDKKRFCTRDLSFIANTILKGNQELDFWVKKAAHNLLDEMSEPSFDLVSGLSLESYGVDAVEEEFESLPSWLEGLNNEKCSMLPWLPLSCETLRSSDVYDSFGDENSPVEVGEEAKEMEIENVSCRVECGPLDDETRRKAISLKPRILNLDSTYKVVDIANEICELCFGNGGQGARRNDPLEVFGLIEPWEADDETASVLLSQLSNAGGEDILWQSQVLCSIILPKFLVLKESASRVLVTATIEFCKLHQKAAVDALLYPLILRKEGINNSICDVATRIIRECLHPAHVSFFCQKLLCEEQEMRRLVCLSCHQCLSSDELVWSESLFTLFQNILNHNVYLTQDSVDSLSTMVQKLGDRYSKSLKLSNFLLSLVTKCEPSLKSHKILLTKAVERTNTFMTKSILSKLACW
ncbi:hypothetical protein ACHQM5_001857 [Ranunculus cassubicifolius]